MRGYTQKQQPLLAHWSEALGTQAFQSHRIMLDHLSNALESAAQRCFQGPIQALFREDLITPPPVNTTTLAVAGCHSAKRPGRRSSICWEAVVQRRA
ncbi:hypothetical protein LOY56_06325 [Pseudomonas sp. B21-048]|nr:hypothetical protein LOY56_06325 [Pseudomonas sp. B21-048]